MEFRRVLFRSHRSARSGQARTRSSMTTLIKRIDHGDVRELRLDRAPVNALNPTVCAQLVEALREAVADGAGGIVLSGGPKVFSAGLDVPFLLTLSDRDALRSEEHTSELQSLMRTSYAVFCLKKKKPRTDTQNTQQ